MGAGKSILAQPPLEVPSLHPSGSGLSRDRSAENVMNDVNLLDKYPTTTYSKLPLASPGDVHHYLPANFPMFPVVNSIYVSECRRTWRLICTARTNKMSGYGKQGIVLFYDEFFHRLFQRDQSIEEVFPNFKTRSEVLVRAMTFMLKAASDESQDIINRSRHLGFVHRTFAKVKAYHFSTFVSTCIEVVMYWLGSHATPDIAEAWSNVVGFYLKHMLQAFLFQNTNEIEFVQNIYVPEPNEDEPKKNVQ